MNESNLVKFFGDNPFIKIVDALIDNVGEDYTKKEFLGIPVDLFFYQ